MENASQVLRTETLACGATGGFAPSRSGPFHDMALTNALGIEPRRPPLDSALRGVYQQVDMMMLRAAIRD